MALFDFPSNRPVVSDTKMATQPWLQWFQFVQNAIVSMYQSGTTANRPTSLLWIGRRYFDTDLGKPVYLKALGSPNVWVDGAGTAS